MEDSQFNTQELFSQNDTEVINSNAWGAFFGLLGKFPCVELTDNSYTVGRGGKIILNSLCPYFSSLSKIHFEIFKENQNVILRDLSQNGTYVNDVKVGKDKTHLLQSNDVISLACQKNKAFVFMHLESTQHLYPMVVRNKYTISRTLGKGACGEVKLAYVNGTGEKVAIKIIDKKALKLASTKSQCVEREVEILRQLNHPCIVKLKDAIDTDERLFIVMELVEGGELFDRVISIKQFEEVDAQVLLYQMVMAIKYLHDNNISHRDLKPENILLATDQNVTLIKVTDFGLSKFVDGATMMKTLCGTPNYLAPEVILGNGTQEYSFACDIWSMGVILFICLAGYPPFTEERTDLPLSKQITDGQYSFPEVHWTGVSKPAIHLIKQMLQVDPKKRITLTKILQHPWMKDDSVKETAMKIMYPLSEVTKLCQADLVTSSPSAANENDNSLSGEPVVKRRKP